jgi:N-acetylglucosaminyldiphosphoundecaprenol N-acetyl-beta-D-mannosaminyltransferase
LISDWVRNGDRMRWLACLNPHSYAVAENFPPIAAALRDADWLIPDGVGIVIASRLQRGAVRERVTGGDVFLRLQHHLNKIGDVRVFFLGSTESTLERITHKMSIEYPRIQVVGTYSPPFNEEFSEGDVDMMVAVVNAANADILWVGLTAPKQELLLHRLRMRLNVKFAAGIGAEFDFYTGRVKRASPVVQRLGLQWLPRLLQEPRRLWRRTFVSAPIFVWHVLRARLRQR